MFFRAVVPQLISVMLPLEGKEMSCLSTPGALPLIVATTGLEHFNATN